MIPLRMYFYVEWLRLLLADVVYAEYSQFAFRLQNHEYTEQLEAVRRGQTKATFIPASKKSRIKVVLDNAGNREAGIVFCALEYRERTYLVCRHFESGLEHRTTNNYIWWAL